MKTNMNIAAQLYTVRDFLHSADDMKRTLEKLSGIGYRAVQLSAVAAMNGDAPQVSASDARQMLDDNGLRCIATHRSWDDLKNATQRETEFHQTLGCDFTAVGSIPPAFRERGAQGYEDFAREATELAAKLNEHGLRFGYHNHAFEFERNDSTPESRRTFFNILVQSSLLMELDVYWIAHAGANPQRIVEQCANRMPVVHLKDKAMEGEQSVMTPVGEGNLDWDNLLPALQTAGAQWLCVEQDICQRDPFDCLKSSWEFLNAHPALR